MNSSCPLLWHHGDQLPVRQPEDEPTRKLQFLVAHRRAIADERTALTNRLLALLKQYFPQALDLCGEELWRPLATDFLLRWSTLQALRKAKIYRHQGREYRLTDVAGEVVSRILA